MSQGPKYQRGMDIADIAKNLRTEMADAVASKVIPMGTYRVTIQRYSGGQSLRIRADIGAAAWNVEALYLGVAFPNRVPTPRYDRDARYTQQGASVLGWLNTAMNAYHRDDSHIEVDHFDCNFYGSVDMAGESAVCARVTRDVELLKLAHPDRWESIVENGGDSLQAEVARVRQAESEGILSIPFDPKRCGFWPARDGSFRADRKAKPSGLYKAKVMPEVENAVRWEVKHLTGGRGGIYRQSAVIASGFAISLESGIDEATRAMGQ